MARRRKGQPVHGWLVLDKPVGMGSTQAVSAARRAFEAQKAGHAGTLDPLADGLLAIAFGEATKTIPFIADALKSYVFTVRWGAATATDDLEGEIIARSEARPDAAAITAALPAFVGEIQQRPPAYSAIKIDGARAYDLARAGAAPEMAARPIHVESLRLLGRSDANHARFELTCGKGGYVRSIARDLGERLGCLGHVVALRRVKSGPFSVERAISFEMLGELSDRARETLLLPLATALDDIPALAVDEAAAARIRQGAAVPITGALAASTPSYGDTVWASMNGTPLAIGIVQAGRFQPTRVFNL